MKLTWLGHAGLRASILIDPWLTENPVFPDGRRAEAIRGATHVLLTHGHGDHSGDALAIARELGIPVVGIADLIGWWTAAEGVSGIDFNKGGTVDLNGAAVTMVNASHSSSLMMDGRPVYTGHESGYMIRGEGRTVYVSGDTDIMADMEWMAELHRPDIGILAAGGHYTMDMERAAWAAKRYFDFKTVVPGHYNTFPLLQQDPEVMRRALPGVQVLTPEVMETVEL